MSFLNFLPAIGKVVDIITGGNAAKDERSWQRRQEALQLDMAKNQIQYRVEDAKKAGIHPMAALGFTGMSYSPVSGAFTGTDFNGLGQDISRAVMANQTEAERRATAGRATLEATQNDAYHTLQLENMELQNSMLRSQIGRLNSAQIGPSMPGAVETRADSVTVGSVGAPERSPGMLTDYSFGHAAPSNDGRERYTLVPSNDMKQRIEDTPQEWGWQLRNGIVPADSIFRDLHREHPPRPGYEWRFDPIQQQFWQSPIRNNRRHY